MRYLNYRLLFLFIAFSFVSVSAHSSNIYWSQAAVSGQQFSSASAACSAGVAALAAAGSINSGAYPITGPVGGGPPSYYYATCKYNYTKSNGELGCSTGCSGLSNARTYGTCDSPDTFNPSTGECVAPQDSCPSGQSWDSTLGLCVNDDPCSSLAGQSRGFKVSGNHKNDTNPFYNPAGNNFVHPDTVIRNGCSGTVLPGTTVCKVNGNGDYTCTGSAMYNGQSGTPNEQAADSSECTGPDCPDTEPTPTTDSSDNCTPWVYGEYGLERQCTSSQSSERPGKGSCLTDGSLVCVKASPTPKSEVTATTSDQTKSTNETTGDVTTVTNNTTNKTICQAGACTTTTTTNKTTVVNNSAGDQIGKSGECSGPLCASATNPDADGDGLGDCVKDCGEDEEGEEGSATVSESCESAPQCDGDPFQCAILIQVHYNSCQERRPLTDEETQTIEAEIDAGYTSNDQAQSDLDSSLGGFFVGFQQAASGNSSGGSGQCLPDKQFTVVGNTITMPFSQVCPYLELFRMALLAMAYLLASRIIHTQI